MICLKKISILTVFGLFWGLGHAQNVGIGTANPTQKLEVVGNTMSQSFIDRDDANFYVDPGNTGTAALIAGNIGVKSTAAPLMSIHVYATDGIVLPAGTSAQRPVGVNGAIRMNTTFSAVEYYDGAAGKWLLVNTPPVGATFIQWFGASDPNTIYPNTTWVATDIQNGEFVRAVGGNSNVANAASLSGTVQAFATGAPSVAFTGSASTAGTHNHVASTANDGDHTHTVSINTVAAHTHTGNTNNDGDHTHTISVSTGGNHSHRVRRADGGGDIRWGDGGGDDGTHLDAGDNDAGGGDAGNLDTDAAGNHSHSATISPNDGNHFHGFTTNSAGGHSHTATVATDGNHTHDVFVNNNGNHSHTVSVNGGGDTETRPANVAAVFWRRIN